MPKRDQCPTCSNTKDVRAIQCHPCRFRDRHPRLGSGPTRYLMRNGYMVVRVNRKSIYEHRHVMEQAIGRKLSRSEHVHHLNGDKTDNRLENLKLIAASEHHRHHMLENGHAKRMSILGHAARWGADASAV